MSDGSVPLTRATIGSWVTVDSVLGDPSRIEKLAAMGILPGVVLGVEQVRPVVVITVGETVLAIERGLSDVIRVHEGVAEGDG